MLKAREENPTWGGRKLRNRLLALGLTNHLSASTITEILRRWQTNFKDEFVLSSKLYCYPLTLLDDHSRISLCIDACGNQPGKAVRQSLERTFIQYGMPFVIYVDNGTPWGNNSGIFAHTRVSIRLMRHDIQIIHGKPYHPQGRGKLERFHRTLKQEVFQARQFGSLILAQKCVNLVR
jgi:transposase InsO family protein